MRRLDPITSSPAATAKGLSTPQPSKQTNLWNVLGSAPGIPRRGCSPDPRSGNGGRGPGEATGGPFPGSQRRSRRTLHERKSENSEDQNKRRAQDLTNEVMRPAKRPASSQKTRRDHTQKQRKPSEQCSEGFQEIEAGDNLLSHRVTPAVPSAPEGLTSVFGMGTGGTPRLSSPAKVMHLITLSQCAEWDAGRRCSH
jgi:hypothetical protein